MSKSKAATHNRDGFKHDQAAARRAPQKQKTSKLSPAAAERILAKADQILGGK